MRNLWIFVGKYNAFFLFVTFFTISLVIIFRNNSFQRASFLNSTNEGVGQIYERVNYWKSYLTLRKTNDSLAAENARLRNELKSSFANDSIEQRFVNDTLNKQQYSYIVANVVGNSYNLKNNFIRINRGTRQGIAVDMGVICPSGVVGIVRLVSENYAVVQSVLHSATMISASVAGTNAFGTLVWGETNFDPQKAILINVANHIVVKPGEKIVTSGLSEIFPAGIPVGTVLHTGIKGGNNFMDIDVKLNTDFTTLQYVYVVNNKRAAEQQQLEARIKENDPGNPN